MHSIIEIIAANARRHPDKLCVADSTKALSYREFCEKIYGYGHILKSKNIKPGDCVILTCTQDVNYMVCFFAIQSIGSIAVPLENKASKNRIDEIVSSTGAEIILYPEEIQKACDFNSKSNEGPWPSSDQVAEILFSTGTTGKSKGIVLTHKNDTALAENVIGGTNMKENNVEMIPMPLSHSHALRRTYGNMVNGSSVVFINGVLQLKLFFELLEKYDVTSMDLSPSMVQIINKLSRNKLSEYKDQLDYIQLGGSAVPKDVKEFLRSNLPDSRLYDFYGTTEAGCSCILDFNEITDKPRCIGKPAANAKFIFVDKDRKPINATKENPGFLATAGTQNMLHYFKEPELTESVMSDGYIYTNDLGYQDSEGYIYYLGREDDVINCGGIKISPEEIEAEVIKNPIVKDCGCIPMNDPIQGQVPKLFISVEGEYDKANFSKFLMDVLDGNKIPKTVEVIDSIPRTNNGKIIRRVLKEM